MTRRRHHVFAAATVLAIACNGGAPADPPLAPQPSALYGEVHIHGFAGGVHPGALFVAHPVPASDTAGDALFPPATTVQAGSCALTLSSSANPAGPLTTPITEGLVDAGLVRILGGNGIAEVDLSFVLLAGSYLPVSALPARQPIFTGGETLQLSGAGATDAPAFAGSLEAPHTLTLTQPSELALVDGADLMIAWLPDHAAQIHATLVASTRDGRWAIVDCRAGDAAGQLALPAALLAQLPAAPRDLQLEVSRDQLGLARGPGDTGVIIHAAYEVSLNAHQP